MMMSNLKKKKDDEESKRFWETAEKAAREVAEWPAWKRLEVETGSSKPRRDSNSGSPDPDASESNER
jgi:hypothetical protein